MDLKPNNGAGLPFTLTPKLQNTTLLFSLTPLVYGSGTGLAVGSGVPPQNNFLLHYFSGRSDNFDPTQTSANPRDARLDSRRCVLDYQTLRWLDPQTTGSSQIALGMWFALADLIGGNISMIIGRGGGGV